MFHEKVTKYCEENNLSASAFEKKCDLPNGLVGKWKANNYMPCVSTLKKISDATGIPIEKWIE